jgi:hypothetical protein
MIESEVWGYEKHFWGDEIQRKNIELNSKFCTFVKKVNMTFEKTYNVQKNNQLIINLPDRFKSRKKVRVTIADIDEQRDEKIALLKKASTDPLFLADVVEIVSDFEHSDNEV